MNLKIYTTFYYGFCVDFCRTFKLKPIFAKKKNDKIVIYSYYYSQEERLFQLKRRIIISLWLYLNAYAQTINILIACTPEAKELLVDATPKQTPNTNNV